jgi:uncharacterized surface protein with fasciclin (FAS1) repeats
VVDRRDRLPPGGLGCYLGTVIRRLVPRVRSVVVACAGALALTLGTGPVGAQFEADPTTTLLENHGELSALATALAVAGLSNIMNDCGAEPVTLLAPIDTAFVSVAGEIGVPVEELLADTDSLKQILEHHVLEGALSLDELLEAGFTPTLHGDDLEVFADEDLIVLDGYATALEQDLITCNGVVHVIDSVLVPADFVLRAEGEVEDAEFDEDGNVVAGPVDDGAKVPFLVLSVLALGAGIGMVNVANRRRPT